MAARPDLKVKEFMVETDPTKVADKWAEWIDNLEYNFKYFKIEDAEAKKAALMVYGGESLKRFTTIYQTLQVVMYLSRLKQS